MTDPRAVSAEIQAEIWRRAQTGQSQAFIAAALHISKATVHKWKSRAPSVVKAPDKKMPEFEWREWNDLAQHVQKLQRKASGSQKFSTVELGDGTHPVYLMPFGDQHLGAIGTDYARFFQLTEQIRETPNLYVALIGDMLEMAIRLRSVAEVCAQIMSPAQQEQFLASWVEEIQHKIAFSCWGNHGEDRTEKQVGTSYIARLLSQAGVYFSGIGHCDLKVGKQTYKIAASHLFRGHSYMNATHSGARYLRFQGIDREIAISGHTHQPAFSSYLDGPMRRVSMVAGTLHVDSGYANRYFSIFTNPSYPVLRLHHERHEFTPFATLKEALER